MIEVSLPSVSVIVRTKNRLNWLQQAVSSVLAQDYPSIELVLVNDGGTDAIEPLKSWLGLQDTDVVSPSSVTLGHGADTTPTSKATVLRSTAEAGSSISLNYIALANSVGRSEAANIGLHSANGVLSIFLDDDDYFDANHISHLVTAFKDHFGTYDCLGVTHCQARAVHQDAEGQEQLLSLQGHDVEGGLLYYRNQLPILTALFPTRVRALGVAFDRSFDLYEDWDFWLQVAQICSFHFVALASCAYRIHDHQSGVRELDRQRLAYQQIYRKWLPRLESESLQSALLRSHSLHRQTIDDLQQQHAKELDRIGKLHDFALQTIANKDGDIAHLTALLQRTESDYLELKDAFLAQHADTQLIRSTSLYYWLRRIASFVRRRCLDLFGRKD